MNQSAAKELTRNLGAITTDQVSWGMRRNDDDFTPFGTSDELRLKATDLRELADTLDSDQILVIDRSGAKARLTIE